MGVPRHGFDRALKKFYDYADNKPHGIDLNGSVEAVTGLSVAEEGFGPFRKVTLTLDGVTVALTDVASTVAYLGKKLYTLPAGAILVMGARADLAVTKSSAGVNDTFDGDFSLGTVTAAGDATLSSTEANLIPSTATPTAVAGATTAKGKSTSTEAAKVLDGTGTAIAVFLNALVDDADQDVTTTPCNLIFSGTIDLFYLNIGDI